MAEQQYSLTSLERKFDDQLTCTVCLDQYTNPKILSCHHSFCLKCVKLLVKNSTTKEIGCPTCRENQILPEGGAEHLPNSFHINNILELQQKLTVRKSTHTTCPKHAYPLKVYCETCSKVICSDCIISKEHKKHDFEQISECYPRHHQEIRAELDLLKHKTADINTAVTAVVTREREVVQQGEDVKKEIHTHAQQLIDQVQMSERHLIQQVDTVVQQKRHLLIKQREQAEKVHTQLKTCEEMVEKSLNEWSQQQVMMEKQKMLEQMKTASSHVEPTVFQPLENADTKFSSADTCTRIGTITSNSYGKPLLKSKPCATSMESTATLTLQSNDGSPFSLPSSLISCKLSSSGDSQPITCDINQTQQGEYNINFTPCTSEHQLIVQVGGVDISGSPFTVPVIPSPVMRGTPVKTITGLNRPYGVAVCDNGDIVVAEWGAHCVTILDNERRKVRSFGTRGIKEGDFTFPRGVAISNDGHVLITDDHRLQKFTFHGDFVKSVGSGRRGSGELQFYRPRGIVVHPTTGEIFVADTGNNRIQVFDTNLTLLYSITLEDDDHQFRFPCDIALDSEGYMYATEWGNHCITKFTTTGEYMARFSSKGSAPGQLNRPYSLTISDNLVYVSEVSNHRVSIFDKEQGTFLYCFCHEGSGEGELKRPYGITTDTLGTLYVSDTDNNRVVVF